LNMTEMEGVLGLAKRKDIESMLAPSRLSIDEMNALLMTRRFTTRDLRFLRNYFVDIPTEEELRLAQWAHLKSLPPLSVLHENSQTWTMLDHGRISLTSNIGRYHGTFRD